MQRERKYIDMIKLLVGVKGTGKTKTLIAAVNQALETSKGYVVCIEKGATLRHEISYKVRLVNTDDYLIEGGVALGGMVAGILAGNGDVTDLFIDGTRKIFGYDKADMALFLADVLVYIGTFMYQANYTYYFIYVVGDFTKLTVASLFSACFGLVAARIYGIGAIGHRGDIVPFALQKYNVGSEQFNLVIGP